MDFLNVSIQPFFHHRKIRWETSRSYRWWLMKCMYYKRTHWQWERKKHIKIIAYIVLLSISQIVCWEWKISKFISISFPFPIIIHSFIHWFSFTYCMRRHWCNNVYHFGLPFAIGFSFRASSSSYFTDDGCPNLFWINHSSEPNRLLTADWNDIINWGIFRSTILSCQFKFNEKLKRWVWTAMECVPISIVWTTQNWQTLGCCIVYCAFAQCILENEPKSD